MRLALATIVTALACHSAWAQTVYRCGVDGREYSQTPCAQSGRPLQVEDRRSDAQRQEATEVAQREERLAQTLEHDRMARERVKPGGAAHLGPAVRTPGTATTLSKKTSLKKKHHRKTGATNGDLVAVVPASRPAKN